MTDQTFSLTPQDLMDANRAHAAVVRHHPDVYVHLVHVARHEGMPAGQVRVQAGVGPDLMAFDVDVSADRLAGSQIVSSKRIGAVA